jgi:Holliday junction resolvase
MQIEKINLKSDIEAKEAFKKVLESKKEYDSIEITGSPADITAIKNGLKYYFEIKFTRQEESYFGAATITEWTAALENPDRFLFVIAQKKEDLWEFKEYTPKEFMEFNTVPPFKTYFNISLNGSVKSKKKRGKSILLTEERIKKMIEFMKELKK